MKPRSLVVLLFAFFCSCDRPEKDTAKKIIIAGRSVISALEHFYIDNERYPDTLRELTTKYLQSIPTPKILGQRSWQYTLLDNNSYQLQMTCSHFVSSYDAVVYRSGKDYPAIWRKKAKIIRMDDWIYVIGFQSIE